ncbi:MULTISPECIES: M48 family metalloprotease [Aphanothece]|uniref:M48 family metalloprotease n=1 Tax=Aphanothece TaxID=1121 RepID=UPI0039854EA7
MKEAPGGRLRLGLLALLLLGGTGLIALLWQGRPTPPLETSLATPFQLLGTPGHLVDRLANRVLPVGDLDEEALGQTLHRRYESQLRPGDPDQPYLDQLIEGLRPGTRRPFTYRAYAIGDCGAANARALPGGVILVCRELFSLLDSEAALVAVLAHEIGHVELGHCFAHVRFELLSRRLGPRSLGQLADAAVRVVLQQPYSKAAEHEADDHAYTVLLASRYDPAAQGQAFAAFNRAYGSGRRRADLILDGLASHPPGALREAEYSQRAEAWWRRHRGERRYRGRRNLEKRRSLTAWERPEEWVRNGGTTQATR